MTIEEKVQLEIDTHVRGHRYSLAYKKQFIKDFKQHGIQHVSEKYHMHIYNTITASVRHFTKFILNNSDKTSHVIYGMSDEEQLQFIADVQQKLPHDEIAAKYNIKYSNINYWCVKLCRKFDIEYIRRDITIYTLEEKIKVIEDYNIFGRSYVVKKYKLNINNASQLIKSFKETINESIIIPNIQIKTLEEKLLILEEYNELGEEYVAKKYNIKKPRGLIYTIKKQLGLEIRNPGKTRTKEEKLNIFNDCNKYGKSYVAEKYDIDIDYVDKMMSKIKKEETNIPMNKCTEYSLEEKQKVVKDYETYGYNYVIEKYGSAGYNVYNWVRSLGKNSTSLRRRKYTLEEKLKMIEDYNLHGKKYVYENYEGRPNIHRWKILLGIK